MTDGVRCTNPKCKAKLAGWLNGELRIKCRNCGMEQTIVRRIVPLKAAPTGGGTLEATG